jgi:transcriptional regulator of arginine metabolism
LEELGAVKVRLPGGETAYALAELPTQQIVPSDHLRRVLGEWVVELAASANMVVLRTPPGCAHVVASALDRSAMRGLLGTVAGDDTVLLVVAEELGGQAMVERLQQLIEPDGAEAHLGDGDPSQNRAARTIAAANQRRR